MLELSQTDLAEALGTSVQQVRAYEDGSQQISTAHIGQLAALLRVPTRFFLEPPNPSNTAKYLADLLLPEEVIDFITSPRGLLLMAAYMQIKDRDIQQCLVDLAEQLARVAKSGPDWLN
jgi:transcriptional regulator with XRE-family HTH domain